MRIVIDMQGAQTDSRFRGIGQYTLSLVKSIIENRADHQIILLLNGHFDKGATSLRDALADYKDQVEIKMWFGPTPAEEEEKANKWRQRVSEYIREAFIANLNPDFVLLTTLFEGYENNFVGSIGSFDDSLATGAILYDLIPLMNPDKYLKEKSALAWYRRKLSDLQRANLLFSISESAKREGLEYLDFKKSNIINIAAAANKHYRPIKIDQVQAESIKKKFDITKEFLMYSGASDERKNHIRLFRAYASLPQGIRDTHQLLLAGGLPLRTRKQFLKSAKSFGLAEDELIFTDLISDQEMLELYNLCKAYVFPSLHEGFGLPALEAMMCGRAVIASNTSSLPELIDYEDALFNPLDIDEIRDKIELVLRDDKYRQTLQEHGLKRSEYFSWEKSAKLVIDSIEKYGANTDKEIEDKEESKKQRYQKLLASIAKIDEKYDERDLLKTAFMLPKNRFKEQKKQLLVDISELVKHDAKSGIQRVVRNILQELFDNPPKGYVIEPVYATTSKQGYYYAKQFSAKFLGKNSDGAIDTSVELFPDDIFLGLDMSPEIQVYQQEYYRLLYMLGIESYFVVYDLLTTLHPEWFVVDEEVQGVVADNFSKWLDVVTSSSGALCISQHTANDLKEWIEINNKPTRHNFKNSVFHMGADITNDIYTKALSKKESEEIVALESGLSFLMVGTIEPRKAQDQVLLAFEQLWAKGKDVNLVIVGKEGWHVDELIKKIESHQRLNKNLFWMNSIDDYYLDKLYGACDCLVAPSRGEGFGLPLIEAAQNSLPIVARDISVFREVATDYAFYFDNSDDSDILACALESWIDLYKEDKHPRSDQMPWLAWRESAKRLTELIMPKQV